MDHNGLSRSRGPVHRLAGLRPTARGLFTDAEAVVALVLMVGASLSAIAYAGPITAPAATLVILAAGLAQGNESRGRLGLILLTIGYGLLTILVLAGVLPPVLDLSLVDEMWVVITLGVVIELLMIVGYWFGLAARRSTAQALAEVQQARIELAGREALLQEARADFDRVAKGAGAGRLTGENIEGYRLGEILGRGAMGEVYAATSDKHDQTVAMKVLHHNLVTDSHLVRRFFAKRRSAAISRHRTWSASSASASCPTARPSWSWSASWARR